MGAVVKLPTAAPRKVRYCRTKAERLAKQRLPQFPDRFICPSIRAKAEEARVLATLERTPELIIATALFQALGDHDKLRVELFSAAFAECERGSAAVAWLRALSGRVLGRASRNDLLAAMGLVNEGRL